MSFLFFNTNAYYSQMKMMRSLFVLLFLAQSGWASRCNKDTGPSGATECVQLENYNQYQWSTCLSSAYIQQKSGQRHICDDPTATYCLYQCMLEVHNKTAGPVLQDCYCESANSTSSPYNLSLNTSLPSQCYSPSGGSCDWYRNCLERKYPCEATSNAYAIRYAEKFCKLYDKRYTLFSADGQKWVDGVRKCLQVVLVPLLRPWMKPTCQEIRKTAFASHTPCYLYPGKGVPSVCDLGCWEYFKIFWTIKGSFTKLDTAWESIKGMWNIGTKCGLHSQIRKCLMGRNASPIKVAKLEIQAFSQRRRRSTDSLSEADARSRLADGVGSVIARTLNWNTDVMDWIAHPANDHVNSDDPDSLHIIIVLADKKALGIVNTTTPSVNFDQTILEFASAIEEGRLFMQVDGSNVWVKSLATCSDKSCDSPQTMAVSVRSTNGNGAVGIFQIQIVLCAVIAPLLVLMDSTVFFFK